jgi:hypothetical protein
VLKSSFVTFVTGRFFCNMFFSFLFFLFFSAFISTLVCAHQMPTMCVFEKCHPFRVVANGVGVTADAKNASDKKMTKKFKSMVNAGFSTLQAPIVGTTSQCGLVFYRVCGVFFTKSW